MEPEARHLPIGLICGVTGKTFVWLMAQNNGVSYRSELNIAGGPVSGRVVRVFEEYNGRLKFYERGKPAPFELKQQYKNRSIRNRLSEETIFHYANILLPGLNKNWKTHGEFRCFEIGGARGEFVSNFSNEAEILRSRKGLGFKWV
ncbi:MAG: hypothetical protein ABJ246_12285 [Paracoccaceae bacterium]